MKTPRPLGTPVDFRRRSLWRSRFEGYRYGITDARLTEWLEQFGQADRDTAARILDAVEFISNEEIHAAFRSLLRKLPGWHLRKTKRAGRFAFVAFSQTAGESGDSMLHQFRLANNLTQRYYDPLFIGRSEIARGRFGGDDTIVFLDDFVGSGKQAVGAWSRMFQELTAGIGNVYLFTIAAFATGAHRIKEQTRIELVTHRHLGTRDSVPMDDCAHFSTQEKKRILHYCKIASPEKPWGFSECGLIIVLSHQCPNNSISILHSASKFWEPLFPRS